MILLDSTCICQYLYHSFQWNIVETVIDIKPGKAYTLSLLTISVHLQFAILCSLLLCVLKGINMLNMLLYNKQQQK